MTTHRFTFPAVALGTMALAPAAFAGQPPSSGLNPPPPAFYTCMATGPQTICRASRDEVEPRQPTDVFCPGFEVNDQGDIHQDLMRRYDANGNFAERVIRETWTHSMWSNPSTGDTVPYTQRDITRDVLGVPGDETTITETQTGENIYTDPVTHKKVMASAGRTVFGPDGTLEAASGQQWAIDAFINGDASVLDGVCAALSR
jgi:hypothetical protein